MPIVTLDLAKGLAISTQEQKQELANEISEVVARVTRRPIEEVQVFFRLHELENVSVGTKFLSDL